MTIGEVTDPFVVRYSNSKSNTHGYKGIKLFRDYSNFLVHKCVLSVTRRAGFDRSVAPHFEICSF